MDAFVVWWIACGVNPSTVVPIRWQAFTVGESRGFVRTCSSIETTPLINKSCRAYMRVCITGLHVSDDFTKIWESFPYLWEVLPYVGSLPMVSPCMGSLPMNGRSCHKSSDLPSAGSLPIQGKSSHVWEDFEYASLPMYGKSSHVWTDLWHGSVPWIPDSARDSKGYPWICWSLSRGTVGICSYCFIVSKHGHELVVAPAKRRFETMHRQHCSS